MIQYLCTGVLGKTLLVIRHEKETHSASLAIDEGNPTAIGFPSQRSVMGSLVTPLI